MTTDNTPDDKNLPRTILKTDIVPAPLINNEGDITNTLKNQASQLDSAFQLLMDKAESLPSYRSNELLPHYNIAFRAQNLYCRTVYAMKLMNDTPAPSNELKDSQNVE